jgi:hypothetical protein
MRAHLAILSAPMMTALAGCAPSAALAPVAPMTDAALALNAAEYRVSGAADLTVACARTPFGFDEGLAAKRAVEAHCANLGRSLQPASLGRYQAGAWVFAGGCA